MYSLLEDKLDLKLKISFPKPYNDLSLSKKNKRSVNEFYNFCKKFFSLWDKYLERITPLIWEFNSQRSSLTLKQMYAEIIAEQYEKYFQDLKDLQVPKLMDNSYKLFLNSLKYKREFYDLYSNDTENKNLDKIKNESILVEEQFWLDVYRKNTEFEGQLSSL